VVSRRIPSTFSSEIDDSSDAGDPLERERERERMDGREQEADGGWIEKDGLTG